MFWLFFGLSIAMLAASVHGIVTGTIMTKFNDVHRAEKPTLFWFMAITYLLIGCYMGFLAYDSTRHG